MAISAIINTGLEKVTQTMLSGMEIAAEQSAKGASFTRGGVAAAKTQVSESVGADVAKEIPGMIKDGFAMAKTQLSESLGPDATELADLVKDGVAGAQAHIPNAIKGAISPMLNDVAKMTGAGVGVTKGVAGKGVDMGKGFSKGMNDLGGALEDVGFVMKDLVKESPIGAAAGRVGKVGGVVAGAVGSAASKVGDSKMGQMMKSSAAMGKNISKMAGVNLGIASLLRQSQLFTGVVGMIFQIIGAFIDILLIPFMPLITMSMKLVAKLLPPMMKVAMWLNKQVEKGLEKLVEGVEWLLGWANKPLSEFWKGLNELGGYFESGAKEVWDGFNHLGRIFAGLGAAFWDGLNHLGRIIWDDGLVAIWDWLKEKGVEFKEWLDGLPAAISGAWDTAKNWIDTNIVQKIKDVLSWTGNFFSDIATSISDGWGAAVNWLVDWVDENIVVPGNAFFNSVGDFISNIATTIKDAFVDGFNAIKDFFTSTVPEAIKTAFGFVTSKIGAIFDFFATVFAPIGNFVQGILNKITGYIIDIIGFLGNAGFGIGQAVRGGMGFDNKEDFNRMIAATRADLSVKEQNSQIELIIKQEQDAAQQAIRAADRQANTVMIKQQQSYDLQLADGM